MLLPLRSTLLIFLAAASVATAAVRGQVSASDPTADIRLGRVLPPAPPEVTEVEPVGPPGPPPWAKARWYRRSHAYYYYPGDQVYFRPADRVWFYRDGGAWRIGDELPGHIRVDFSQAVPITIESDRPYVHQEAVASHYPADYFDRVQFKPVPVRDAGRKEYLPIDEPEDDRNDRKAQDKLTRPR